MQNVVIAAVATWEIAGTEESNDPKRKTKSQATNKRLWGN